MGYQTLKWQWIKCDSESFNTTNSFKATKQVVVHARKLMKLTAVTRDSATSLVSEVEIRHRNSFLFLLMESMEMKADLLQRQTSKPVEIGPATTALRSSLSELVVQTICLMMVQI